MNIKLNKIGIRKGAFLILKKHIGSRTLSVRCQGIAEEHTGV